LREPPARMSKILPPPFVVARGYGVAVSDQRIKDELGVSLAYPT
jgi:hypothetical protein